jgi:hypothetical protein
MDFSTSLDSSLLESSAPAKKWLEEISCVVCKEVPRNPLETLCCSTIYCWNCYTTAPKECPKCLTIQEVRPNIPLMRLLKNMPLKRRCGEGECEFRGTDSEIEAHLTNDCEFVKVPCSNNDLCTHISIRKDMAKHEQEDCPWLQRICPYDPDHKVFNCAYEEHVESCMMRPFTCPNEGCGLELRKKELQIHLDDECEFAAVACPFSHSGCLALVYRKDIGKHLRDNTELHLSMLAKRVKEQQDEISELTRVVSEVRHDQAIEQAPRSKFAFEGEKIVRPLAVVFAVFVMGLLWVKVLGYFLVSKNHVGFRH